MWSTKVAFYDGKVVANIVIYTTDHGDAAGSHRMMDKHYVMYEEEVHVPLLVRWPGHVAPGSTCTDFVSNGLDLGPTILEAFGLDIPETFQGKSFLPLLQGQKMDDRREVAFSTYHGQQFGLYDMRMVRDERYMYIWNPTDIDEFYDLQEDPAELVNLAGSEVDQCLGPVYRQKILDIFGALDDRLITLSPWMRQWLGGSSPLNVFS
jgi:arylsulfatase A-like enzyme